jgi:hypothetical protein
MISSSSAILSSLNRSDSELDGVDEDDDFFGLMTYSHVNPLLSQKEQIGCSSSHYKASVVYIFHGTGSLTLTFRVLQVLHPPLDFLCGRFVMKSPGILGDKRMRRCSKRT